MKFHKYGMYINHQMPFSFLRHTKNPTITSYDNQTTGILHC